MAFIEEEPKNKEKQFKELELVINKAIKKVGGSKENDLCKYIPMNSGGYMHHFTLKKMKNKKPEELSSLIEKFIVEEDRPLVVAPKQRAARGSRKKKDYLNLSNLQRERLLNIARLSGDKEIISLLSTPKESLASCKRKLIESIRKGIVDHERWEAFVEAVNAQQATIAAGIETMMGKK